MPAKSCHDATLRGAVIVLFVFDTILWAFRSVPSDVMCHSAKWAIVDVITISQFPCEQPTRLVCLELCSRAAPAE
jgi:hypothetical protein